MTQIARHGGWPARPSQRWAERRGRGAARGRQAGRRPAWACDTGAVSWFLTLLGIIALIILHELGHFVVAKAVGMRVERFSLFFPPTLFRIRRGETEYAIGAIPAGGYVKITGMNPEELEGLEPQVARRGSAPHAPWKRIVVILAGPGVNIVIAFVLFWVILVTGNLNGAGALESINPSIPTLK